MKDNCSLEELYAEALMDRQAAYAEFVLAGILLEKASEEKEKFHDFSIIAYEVMNEEYTKKEEMHQKLREEYEKVRAQLDGEIKIIQKEADREHEKMRKYFRKADRAYKNNRKYKAPDYSDVAYRHQVRRDELNSMVRDLVQKIRAAKAEFDAKDTENSKAYHEAKRIFQITRQNHRRAVREYNSAYAEYKAKAEALKNAEAKIANDTYELLCV